MKAPGLRVRVSVICVQVGYGEVLVRPFAQSAQGKRARGEEGLRPVGQRGTDLIACGRRPLQI